MVERTEPVWNSRDGLRLALVVFLLTVACAAGFWALAGVDTPRNTYPALTTARDTAMLLFGATALACAIVVVWDRLRQPGPESERELSLEAFTDVRMGLARPLIGNLAYSFVMLQVGLTFAPDFLTLVTQQSWLKVLAAAPLMVLAVVVPIARYPALVRDWRVHRAAV